MFKLWGLSFLSMVSFYTIVPTGNTQMIKQQKEKHGPASAATLSHWSTTRDCTVWIAFHPSALQGGNFHQKWAGCCILRGNSILENSPPISNHRFASASLKCPQLISACFSYCMGFCREGKQLWRQRYRFKATFRPPVICELAKWESFIPFSFHLSSHRYWFSEEYFPSTDRDKH